MAEEPTDAQLVGMLKEAKVAIVEALEGLDADDEVSGFGMSSDTTFAMGASPAMATKLGPKFKPGWAENNDGSCVNIICGPGGTPGGGTKINPG